MWCIDRFLFPVVSEGVNEYWRGAGVDRTEIDEHLFAVGSH